MDARYIEDIPTECRQELVRLLDNNPVINWRKLVSHMPNGFYDSYKVEEFAMQALDYHGSPTNALLNDLARRHVTLQQLVSWLQHLTAQGQFPRLQELLLRLRGQTESLVIVRQPDSLYRHQIGNSVYIKCQTSPSNGVSYQWFKRKVPLQGQVQPLLHLQNISKDHEGYYICRVSLDGQNCLFTNWAKLEVLESQPEMAKPIITTQPCYEGPTILGETLHLYCDAVGDPAPSYQWFKDSRPIPGASCREYTKANLCQDDEGTYHCVVGNRSGQACSERVAVQVCKRYSQSDNQFGLHGRNPSGYNEVDSNLPPGSRVSDKVALLIGNKDYKDERLGPLYHPTNDVSDLAGVLTSIGFKVVSLINLTLHEMKFAVSQFYEMLDENMYALFYFAGHGFEVDKESYLMPVDATPNYLPNENLSASKVVKIMQSSQAYFNMVILDSCRTQPKRDIVKNPSDGLAVQKQNVMIVFPCCSKNSVFESESHTNSFFAYYLLQHIGRNETINNVMIRVSEDIFKEDIRDPGTNQQQIVYRNSTIADLELSLKTPVDERAVARSSEKWRAAHEIPQHPITVFQEGDCIIEFLFFAEFSNVLLVHARLAGDNIHNSFILEPKIQKNKPVYRHCCLYDRIDEKDHTVPTNFPRTNCLFQAIRVRDLQRLKNNLTFEIEVLLPNNQQRFHLVQHTMDDRPLYAKITTHNAFCEDVLD